MHFGNVRAQQKYLKRGRKQANQGLALTMYMDDWIYVNCNKVYNCTQLNA